MLKQLKHVNTFKTISHFLTYQLKNAAHPAEQYDGKRNCCAAWDKCSYISQDAARVNFMVAFDLLLVSRRFSQLKNANSQNTILFFGRHLLETIVYNHHH